MTTAILKKVADQFSLSEDQVLEAGIRSFLQSQLRALEAERQSIFAKYGVNALRDLDEYITDRPDQESENLDDLRRADYLTDQVLQIQSMLDDLNGHD